MGKNSRNGRKYNGGEEHKQEIGGFINWKNSNDHSFIYLILGGILDQPQFTPSDQKNDNTIIESFYIWKLEMIIIICKEFDTLILLWNVKLKSFNYYTFGYIIFYDNLTKFYHYHIF